MISPYYVFETISFLCMASQDLFMTLKVGLLLFTFKYCYSEPLVKLASIVMLSSSSPEVNCVMYRVVGIFLLGLKDIKCLL